jgi:hypothetical protein
MASAWMAVVFKNGIPNSSCVKIRGNSVATRPCSEPAAVLRFWTAPAKNDNLNLRKRDLLSQLAVMTMSQTLS